MTLWKFIDRCEAEYLAALLVKHDGNVPAVAKESGTHRSVIYKRLRKHNLIAPRTRDGGNREWRALQ